MRSSCRRIEADARNGLNDESPDRHNRTGPAIRFTKI
jgi:hypothetical protein